MTIAGNVHRHISLFFLLTLTVHIQTRDITCQVPSDLIFVLDGSESLSEMDFLNMKNFVISLLAKLDVQQHYTRVGVVVFGTFPGDIIELGEVNYVQVLNLRIVGLNQPKSGATGTARGLERMREMFANRSRPGAVKLGVVITDGLSMSPKDTIYQATQAKADGIQMISIGFGSHVFRNELIQIAGTPDNVFASDDFNQLLQTVESAVKSLVCQVIIATTETPVFSTPPISTLNPTTQAPTTSMSTNLTSNTAVPTIRAPNTQAPNTEVPVTPAPTTPAPPPTIRTTVTEALTTYVPKSPVLSVPVPTPTTPARPTQTPTIYPVTDRIGTSLEFCPNCVIGRDWGLRSFPGDCTKFVTMFPDDRGGRIETLQKCPFGTYWQLSTLSCQFSFLVDCIYDPCRGVTSGAVPMRDVCSGYWSCINGQSFASCCSNRNQRFIPGHGCIDDPSCFSECPPGEPGRFLTSMYCSRYTDPVDPTKYVEVIPGYGNMSRSCATGTMFMAGDCACTKLIDDLSIQTLQMCTEDVYLDFDDSFSDRSGNDIAAGLENVVLDSKAVLFSGDGMINMWRFSNTDFRKSLVIKFKFMPNKLSLGDPIQALVTNCIFSDKQESSLAISIIPANRTIYFKTVTDEGVQEIRMTYDATAMNDVIYIYDGVKITGIVNGNVVQAPLTGDIARRQSGIVLGAGSKFGNYFGKMDEVKIYLCFPDDVIQWL